MRLIWSRAKSHDPICFFLEEPVSHVAICFFECIVFHATFSGVDILSKNDFMANRDIIFVREFDLQHYDEQTLLLWMASTQTWKKYDWSFFFWICKQAIMHKLFKRPLPRRVEVQNKGHILCTEILELLPEDMAPRYNLVTAVTPYQLYLQLEK
jgi:hypothetical protein